MLNGHQNEAGVEYGSHLGFMKIVSVLSFTARHVSQAKGESACLLQPGNGCHPKLCWYQSRATPEVRETLALAAAFTLSPVFQRFEGAI
jgi:hypothetical protein